MIEWIKKIFCMHDYIHVCDAEIYENDDSKRPYKARRVYMCKKCGKAIKIKI